MKKRINTIWGVGLTLVLAVSLLLSAAPVSAGTLSWGDEDLPDELEFCDVLDLAVSPDGGVIYATDNSGTIWRSTDHGVGWSEITLKVDSTVTGGQLVAVALDDENYIAVANTTTNVVYISDDAGANWDSLGVVDNATASLTTIRDLAISPEKGGNHFVGVCGVTSNTSDVWHYEIGSVGADWKNTSFATTYAGWSAGEVAGAVAFSPNFASDQVMTVVTADIWTSIDLQIFSFNQSKWNASAGFAGYPADVVAHDTDSYVMDLKSASIAMAPDYLGSDDAMRIVFVGTTTDNSTTEDEACGIFRMDDDDVEELKLKKNIHSVDYDGTNLVAGLYDGTTVYRCADPLGSSPSVSGSTSRKGPGGTDKTVVAFAGTDVVAGTSGDESAFAISRDDGKTFNDISLISTKLEVLSDVAVTPDGEKVYLATANGTNLSLWRYASSWERVLSEKDADNDYIIRMAPDDPDVLYVADKDSDTIFFTSNGGETKWHKRISKEDIVDLAVEGDGDVAYVLTGPAGRHVSKSTNSGFTWATKISHKITEGGNMIVSLGEDEVLVGGANAGKVSYSTNGGTTWTKLSDGMTAGNIQTIATGLDDGDFVFAAPSTADDYIYRWEIGEDDEWDKITADADITSAHGIYGLALQEGLLYALAGNVTPGGSMCLRSIDPTADDPSWSSMTSTTEIFNVTPSALRVSRSEDITKLWAIDNSASPNADLFSYKDTLATVVPRLTSPRDGADIPMNPVSGAAFQVTLTWETPSDKVRKYNLNIAFDDDFDEEVLAITMTKSSGTWDEGDIISAVCGPDASGNLSLAFMPDTTYYWKVRVASDGPVKSGWSEVRSFNIEELEITPPVIVEPAPPAPVIEVPPAPSVTLPAPEVTIELPPEAVQPPPEIVIPPAPAAPAPITPAYIWAIIIIGAILVIAVVVLIVRTRRPV